MKIPIESIKLRPAIGGVCTARWTWTCPRCGVDVYERTSTPKEVIAADACCLVCRKKPEKRQRELI